MSRRLSFTTLATPDLPITAQIALATEYGFTGVDLRHAAHRGDVLPGASAETLQAVAHAFRAAALDIPSVLSYPACPVDAESPWSVYAADVAEALRIAAALGAPAARIFTPKVRPPHQAADVLAEATAVLGRVLADTPGETRLLIQNHANHCTARQAVTLCEQVGSPRLGLAFSPDHEVHPPPADWSALLEAVLPWTRQLYVADCGGAPAAPTGVLPGEGVVPLADIIRRFEDHGFDGYFTFKWERLWNPRLAPPPTAFPVFMAFMDSCAGALD